MISLEKVSRWYGQVIGLNDVTCQIGPGLTALLGMNGAGKTTLMRLVTGQLKETTGHVSVLGMTPFANPELFRRLGYCPEIDNFYEHWSGRRFVYFLGRMAGFDDHKARLQTQAMLERVGMADRADKPIASYSKGMRQRIKLAQALIHDPEVLLLDEPLNGLDPLGRKHIADLLREFAQEGKTVVISSHILYEVEQITQAILLLHRGRLLATGDLRVIRSLIDKHPHQVRIETDRPRDLAKLLASLENVVSLGFQRDGRTLELEVRSPDVFYDKLGEIIENGEAQVTGFSSPDNNLESVFKYLVNE